MLDLWYKNAVIYCLDVETFMDSNGDGVGDFRGLTDRLDHLEALGVNAVWLNPFYPSPNRDNGYDISDFYGVDPRLGTLGDFVQFSRAARDRGIKVIVDLVVNHTSVDHPWFQESRDPDSPRRDWYVWVDEKPDDITEGAMFPGVQDTVWTQDDRSGGWYLHRFYAHQADLNMTNPAVREEVMRIMGFWLELGVWGFRVDAAPYLADLKGLESHPETDPKKLLSDMRDFLSWRRAGSIMLAEANVPHEEVGTFFGGEAFGTSERMHMIFDFPLNQRLYLSLARGDVAPLVETLRSRPADAPDQAQWANFLRNHDELTLDQLSDEEREEVFAAFAPREDMRIYGRGIRRRLAPMMEGDPRRIDMLHSLVFALPGTPVMWYGDEIGMGEDLSLPERLPVRLPMPWTDGPQGGFSEAEELVRPALSEGPLAYPKVNVAHQVGDPDSRMGIVQRLIRARRAAPELGWGAFEVLDSGHRDVLALRSEWRGGTVLTVHNIGPEGRSVSCDIADGETLVPLLGPGAGERANGRGPIELGPYGFAWYRLGGPRR